MMRSHLLSFYEASHLRTAWLYGTSHDKYTISSDYLTYWEGLIAGLRSTGGTRRQGTLDEGLLQKWYDLHFIYPL